jgi:hypothetical protein
MSKNEICWAIFSGVTLLPFTIRTTKKQCISNFLFDRSKDKLGDHESCRKVVINEFNHP